MTFSFGFVSAQYLVEDNDITENSKEFGRADISLDMLLMHNISEEKMVLKTNYLKI